MQSAEKLCCRGDPLAGRTLKGEVERYVFPYYTNQCTLCRNTPSQQAYCGEHSIATTTRADHIPCRYIYCAYQNLQCVCTSAHCCKKLWQHMGGPPFSLQKYAAQLVMRHDSSIASDTASTSTQPQRHTVTRFLRCSMYSSRYSFRVPMAKHEQWRLDFGHAYIARASSMLFQSTGGWAGSMCTYT